MMYKKNLVKGILLFQILMSNFCLVIGQEIPIINYSVNGIGQVQLEVNSTTDQYYVLKIRHDSSTEFELPSSLTLGQAGTTIITEPLGFYPVEHYQVLAYSMDAPNDFDGDGVDDIAEFNNTPVAAPFNPAASLSIEDGSTFIDSQATFSDLSFTDDFVQWSEFLNGREYVKFLITDFNSNHPNVYFINSDTHLLHADFGNAIGVDHVGENVKKGQIIYHPNVSSNDSSEGTYTFNYSNGHGDDFEVVQRSNELLAANMPFLKNNFSYFITALNEDEYERDFDLFQNARVGILSEEAVYGGLDYIGLNQTEGFGLFRHLSTDEVPGQRDIVLYESLPNSLPRVGGIMTSVIQTPLSHVNIRAIQNEIPNAYIRDPLSIDSIANLIDHYIYYNVGQNEYTIREATLEEVNDWFEATRPTEEQIPPLNLNYQSILPLDEVTFMMYDGFGAKAANIATMRTFGFPEGTIPNGFSIPFYYYQEFMKYNGFFDDVELMLNNAAFQTDRAIRDDLLDEFRDKIKDATMPDWMLDELAVMHASFPSGTSIRCRSSTNNEDLPGFSGAGLYDSKTQHPDEGHISKSVKQVYASLWNLRAYEEREFYKVNHYMASMGILCHPNYKDEKVNGVGVSTDPLHNTSDVFYLNSQLGEELITNPSGNTIAEEILLNSTDDDFTVIQFSDLVADNTLLMEPLFLDQIRDYLTVIHDEFAIRYDAVNDPSFAMDIEYKITRENQLIIKQARPWASFRPEPATIASGMDQIELTLFPNPVDDYLFLRCEDCNLVGLKIMDIMGKEIQSLNLIQSQNYLHKFSIDNLPVGVYLISGFSADDMIYSVKFVKK